MMYLTNTTPPIIKHLSTSYFHAITCSIIAMTAFLWTAPTALFAQTPVAVTCQVAGEMNAAAMGIAAQENAPKECMIDFHFSAPTVRVVMQSPDGQTDHLDRVFDLNVHANPDSTWVAGKPGAWTIGLGRFTGVDAFVVKLFNAQTPGQGTAIGEGTYP